MATVTVSESTSRVPLSVSHGADTTEYNNNVYRTTKTTSSHGIGGSGSGIGETTTTTSAFDMKNVGDETDRIKIRMKEFEDRCKRWREDFFARSNQTGSLHHADHRSSSSIPTTDFNNNNIVTSSTSAAAPPPFASSLHRSSVEDNPETGGKKYKIEFDIGDFKQNELQISTNNRTLTVKGDREVKAGSATETKTFNRELTVPDYVDMEKMNAFLMENTAPPSNSPSKQQIVSNLNGVNNILILEAPIILEKYSYRRSAFDNKQNQSPINIKNIHNISSSSNNNNNNVPSSSSMNLINNNNNRNSKPFHSESHHTENKTSTTSSTHTTRIVQGNGGIPPSYELDANYSTPTRHNRPMTIGSNENDDYFYGGGGSPAKNGGNPAAHHQSNQSLAPELIAGYPVYDSAESCVIYKFDFNGFDQSDIHLTITVDRTLEIKACKEITDNFGKVYREFKREIQLEPEVDANLIKNLLYEGILTLKIPKPTRPDGSGTLSNNHNINSPNGFQEFYTDDGKLAKLTSDFRGYNPENVKIVLSANNILKVNAHQSDSSPTHQNQTVQKECSRQYSLPAWIQPEQMKAIMSRDGILTVDFTK